MKTLSSLLVVALSSLSLAACGVKLPGGMKVPGGGSLGGTAAQPTVETAAQTIGPDRKVDPKLVAYYQQLDSHSLYKLLFDSARDDIYEQAKSDVGRDLLWQSGNPDPAWIKVWSTKDWSYASGNAETLMQAAFNRTWEDGCKAEYASSAAAHARLAADLQPELDAVDALTNHYARRAGYVALAARFEQAAAAAGLDPRKDPFGAAGFRITILQHAIAYHQASPEAYAAFPWDDYALARAMQEHGRAITADGAFELQAYCGGAAAHGGLSLTSFGSLWGSGHASNRNVAWPTVWGDQDAVAAKVKALVADTGKSLATRDGLRIGSVRDVEGIDFASEEPKLARLDELTVDKVAGSTITLSRKRGESYEYSCRATRRIDRIEDDGHIVYQQVCKYGERTYTLKATVTFAQLPPAITLAKGDVISFTADVDKDASKKVKETAAKVEWVRTMTLTGRVLGSVKRGKQTLSF